MSSRQPIFPTTSAESISHSHLPFVTNVEDFTCSICYGVFETTVRACGNNHLFCKSCLETAVEMTHNGNACPNCRGPIVMSQASDGMSIGSAMPMIDKLIESHFVKCRDGCEAVFPLRQLNDHRKTCSDRVVDCPYSTYGCDHRCKRSEMEAHLKKEVAEHTALSFYELSHRIKSTDRLLKSAYNQSGSVMLSRFDGLQQHVVCLDKQVCEMNKKLDALIEGVGIVLRNSLAYNTEAAAQQPLPKRARKASDDEMRSSIARLHGIHGVSDKSDSSSKRPFASTPGAPDAQGVSCRVLINPNYQLPPLAEGGRELVLATNPDSRLPALEAHPLQGSSLQSAPVASPLGSPAYSPTSPVYSPTSPAYSPSHAGPSGTSVVDAADDSDYPSDGDF